MKMYSNSLTAQDVRDAFTDAREIDHQDIYLDGLSEFRPRCSYHSGVQFYAYSLHGSRTPHDGMDRAAGWDAYGYVIARLFLKDRAAKIGCYDGAADFVWQVNRQVGRREPKDFLKLMPGLAVAVVDEEQHPPKVVAWVPAVADAEEFIDGIWDRDKVARGGYGIDAS